MHKNGMQAKQPNDIIRIHLVRKLMERVAGCSEGFV